MNNKSTKRYDNIIINKLLDDMVITQSEYDILFCSKDDWSIDDSMTSSFNKTLQKIIISQTDKENLDLSFIEFSHFTFSDFNFNTNQAISFQEAQFHYDADFQNSKFTEKVSFEKVKFKGEVNFGETIFHKEANFFKSTFYKTVGFYKAHFYSTSNFKGSHFHGDAYFWITSFNKKADFVGITSEKIISFGKSSFKKLNLINSRLKNVDFLEITGNNDNSVVTLSKIHFENKETARLIKSDFEKQNNITESNKYFAIEQDFYIDYLHNVKTEPNRIPSLTALYLNKWISNFGTDWVRSLLFLFVSSYLFIFIYINLDAYLGTDQHIKHFTNMLDILYVCIMMISWVLIYMSTFFKYKKLIFWILLIMGMITGIVALYIYDNVLSIQNYIIQLTNPVNAFKNMNLYEGIEIYGAFVRIVIVTIIYQFIVAFRQNTRRK